MLETYFRGLYQRAMREAYAMAHDEIVGALGSGGACLDCGASLGGKYELLYERIGLKSSAYHGLEWDAGLVEQAKSLGRNVLEGDLNKTLPFSDQTFRCVFGLSVLEHLLFPCRYMRECQRVLQPGGVLVLLTPNISTFFTAALILLGKMPSSGPYPDSDLLLKQEELFKVSSESLQTDAESDVPGHRHLVIFSYRVLRSYLHMLGFSEVRGYGFGLYPFPNFMQPLLEKIDPYHCHQMVFVAKK